MFLTQMKAEDRSPWGNFWFEPVGVRTMSGLRVSADTSMQLSAVFRAVGLVSGHMALLPLKFYKRGTRKQVSHPLLNILNVRPNPFQNAFEWREMLQGHLELRGNCYNEIISDRKGQITALMPRHPDRVRVEGTPDGDYRYIVTDQNGAARTVQRGSMWHVRGLSGNGITGISVIECARESFGLGLSAQSYGARFFANDAKPVGGWVEYPGSYKDKTQREQIRESLQDAQSGANRGKLMMLDHGMKYHEVGLTNTDAQFLETRRFSVTDIARWFGIPPHKLGDLDKATFSNIEQQALEYIQDALLPRGARWKSSIVAELLFDDEEIDVSFDYTELLRGDSAAMRAYYHGGILDGWLTRNEARDMEGREPLDGLDEPLRPLNMVEEKWAEDEEKDEELTEPKDQEDKESTDKKNNARLRAVLQGNAERMARRLSKTPQGEIVAPLIASALSIPLETAQAWCATNKSTDEAEIFAELIKLSS